jgi:hypothetical protein
MDRNTFCMKRTSIQFLNETVAHKLYIQVQPLCKNVVIAIE